MAVLFLLALFLIVWQALRIEPSQQPVFEIATKGGEQVAPVAVPSWRLVPELPGDPSERLVYLRGCLESYEAADLREPASLRTISRIMAIRIIDSLDSRRVS